MTHSTWTNHILSRVETLNSSVAGQVGEKTLSCFWERTSSLPTDDEKQILLFARVGSISMLVNDNLGPSQRMLGWFGLPLSFFNEASKVLNPYDKFWKSIKERGSTGWSENRCRLPDICNSKLSFCYMYSFVAKARMFHAVCNWG